MSYDKTQKELENNLLEIILGDDPINELIQFNQKYPRPINTQVADRIIKKTFLVCSEFAEQGDITPYLLLELMNTTKSMSASSLTLGLSPGNFTTDGDIKPEYMTEDAICERIYYGLDLSKVDFTKINLSAFGAIFENCILPENLGEQFAHNMNQTADRRSADRLIFSEFHNCTNVPDKELQTARSLWVATNTSSSLLYKYLCKNFLVDDRKEKKPAAKNMTLDEKHILEALPATSSFDDVKELLRNNLIFKTDGEKVSDAFIEKAILLPATLETEAYCLKLCSAVSCSIFFQENISPAFREIEARTGIQK